MGFCSLPTRLVICLLLFCINIFPTMGECNEEAEYVIRSTASGFVLDASDLEVTIQYYAGFTPQFWQFERSARPGLFYIVNKSTGNVLDYLRNTDPPYVIVSPRDASLYQEWFINSSGSIVNAASNLCLDIISESFTPGNRLQVYRDNGSGAQKFTLQEK